MIQAILYLSNTGFTEKYAQLLKKRLNIPAYSMKSSIPLANDSEIIYLGWLKAGFVSGYKKPRRNIKSARYWASASEGTLTGRQHSQCESDSRRNTGIQRAGRLRARTSQGSVALHTEYEVQIGHQALRADTDAHRRRGRRARHDEKRRRLCQ